MLVILVIIQNNNTKFSFKTNRNDYGVFCFEKVKTLHKQLKRKENRSQKQRLRFLCARSLRIGTEI